MTEFVVSARLIADAAQMVTGANQGAQAIDRVGESSERAGAKAREFGAFTADQSAQLRSNAAAVNQVIRATNPLISNTQQLEAALNRARAGFIAGTVSGEAYARAEAIAARGAIELAAANRTAANSTGQMRFGTMMLGQQIQDVGIQLASGAGFARTFAMQAGQTALAIQQMGGRASGFATFIGGPWGSLILAGVSVLAMMTSGLFANADAAEAAHAGADGLSDAQGVLGDMFNLTSGKIEHQNALLRANITLMAVQMQAQAIQERDQARQTYQSLGYRGNAARLGTIGEAIRLGVSPTQIPEQQRRTDAYSLRVQRLLSDVGAGRVSSERALQLSAQIDFSGLNVTREAFQQAIINRLSSSAKDDTATRMLQSLGAGVLDPALRRSGGGGSQRRGRTPTDQTEFGQDTADKLTSITQRFTDSPPQIEAVRKALAEVDDIVTDIERRHPPNMQALLDQARAAGPIIEAGINKPFDDFIRSQEESIRLAHLQAQGHDLEAEAMQQILRIEQQQGPLQNSKREAILANVVALHDEQRAMEVLHEQQQRQLGVLAETRKSMEETVAGLLGGDARSALDVPRQLIQSFNRLTAQSLVEGMFGDAFRQLEDHVTGRDRVEAANIRLSETADAAAHSIARMADAAEAARTGVATSAQSDAVDQDIVVTGNRLSLANPRAFFQNMVETLLQGVVGTQMARTIGIGVGRGLEGAAFGGQVQSVLQMAGIRLPNGAGQIGGALLNQFPGVLNSLGTSLPQLTAALPAIGAAVAANQAISGLLGNDQIKHGKLLSLVFGPVLTALFGSAKRGSATITSVDGAPSTRGNSDSRIASSAAAATSVQGIIQQIADALGGSLGSFAGSIGVRKEKFVVDPTGQGRTKGSGTMSFDTEAEATAALLRDLLADGAVRGISAAVQRALLSSPDISKALREASKVEEVETLVKGLGGALEKQFRDFEQQAAERVRIASQYGFDVLEIEKINAADRLKLEQSILDERIGSLRTMLDDINFGDLFEGSMADQRNKLIAELDKATADAKAGIDGAGDRQAQLSRDLIDLSRQAFGTAGPEFAADLDRARSGAEQVIAIENQRLKAAEDAVKETNSQLNEANGQLSQQTTILQGMAAYLAEIAANGAGGGGGGAGGVDTARYSLF